jgi:hypothetical protein
MRFGTVYAPSSWLFKTFSLHLCKARCDEPTLSVCVKCELQVLKIPDDGTYTALKRVGQKTSV